MNEPASEINFDGLVGPTHNYAGLSTGNLASTAHRGAVSHPRAAALQGLAKMWQFACLGVPQAVLPPQARPDLDVLRAHGFRGTDAEVLRDAREREPDLLLAASSASSMWVANAATVTPSSDAADRRVHFTPANLTAKFHRSIEPPQTARTLQAIFADRRHFVVHPPVASATHGGDEGAANHTRLAPRHGAPGIHLFVHGYSLRDPAGAGPRRFPARQSLETASAIAQRHGIPNTQAIFARQAPAAIDAGVFHHDVISVGNENVLLFHADAFAAPDETLLALRQAYARAAPAAPLVIEEVPAATLSLADAVQSYLFNSQIVTLPDGTMALIAPIECARMAAARDFIQSLIESRRTPIAQVHFLDLGESMRNGGGPACLRLRVVLTETERAAIVPKVFLDPPLHETLERWIRRWYRESLEPAELADPLLLDETRRALDELTQILQVGSIYPFQLA